MSYSPEYYQNKKQEINNRYVQKMQKLVKNMTQLVADFQQEEKDLSERLQEIEAQEKGSMEIVNEKGEKIEKEVDSKKE